MNTGSPNDMPSQFNKYFVKIIDRDMPSLLAWVTCETYKNNLLVQIHVIISSKLNNSVAQMRKHVVINTRMGEVVFFFMKIEKKKYQMKEVYVINNLKKNILKY